jgi:Rod binding domain-containing protein
MAGRGALPDLLGERRKNELSAIATPHDGGQSASTAAETDRSEVQLAFQNFVGQTLFGQMLASMRETQGDVAYMNGGRAEEIFREQLDQVLVEQITTASAHTLSDPMFEQFLRHTANQ